MSRKIVITSGKGGVGKTTVTANLGLALSEQGKSVVMFDLDIGLNNLDVVLGIENRIVYDLNDVLSGRCRIKQALIPIGKLLNLYILPSKGINAERQITGQNVKLIVESISQYFDYVLLDCPAGIDMGFHRAVSASDEAIVVATPSVPSLKDADKTISILNSYKLNKINLVINRARGDLIIGDKMLMPKECSAILKTDLIGVLPEEDCVFLSSGQRLPNNSESKKAYRVLAKNIITNQLKIYDVTNKYSGFFGSIRRGLKKSV